MPKDEGASRSETVLLALGCVVVGAWVTVVLIQGLFPSHVVPTEVHGIAFVVASSLFGSAAWRSRKGNGGAPGA